MYLNFNSVIVGFKSIILDVNNRKSKKLLLYQPKKNILIKKLILISNTNNVWETPFFLCVKDTFCTLQYWIQWCAQEFSMRRDVIWGRVETKAGFTRSRELGENTITRSVGGDHYVG